MSVEQPGLGEQALSKAAEIGLSTQLDKVEELNVDIRTEPIQLMQGELESVFELKGMSLRLKNLDVQPGNLVVEAEAYIKEFPSS